jgi:macrodomain Ter protein organizer (MatP/YcbG family)
MKDERLKNIGLKKDVWLQLSTLAKEREITLSEAVDYLLKRSKSDGNQPDSPDRLGDDKPD